MVELRTGNVIHIDFRHSFESAIHRASFPEKVQFRLTRMVEKSLEASTVTGSFKTAAEIVLGVLRVTRWSISALISIFISEPLHGQDLPVTAAQAITQVHEKVQGEVGDWNIIPTQRVALLIEEARNPMNYIQHHESWRPFW
jgi:phosphatidylinositol kinase/protein kinase (PI-3  family)